MSDGNSKIACKICGARVHSIQLHLKEAHPEMSLGEYQTRFPGEPILSDIAKQKLAEQETRNKAAAAITAPAVASAASPIPAAVGTATKKAFHEIFGLGKVKAALNGKGDPIPVSVFSRDYEPDLQQAIDPNHVFDIEILKNIMMGLELNIPVYAWGYHGSGKTTTLEQACARTCRPTLRVQHTVNTEESHIVGQWTARGGNTHFELGPLPLAMKYGWVYLADEYDYALPSVLSVYQSVLEGKSLVIKEADAANRVIKPHANFRFVATGNTNGSGDETGLYQGTQIQNAANYDRFGVVINVPYMSPEIEVQVLLGQAKIAKGDADKLVDFANRVRESYAAGQISNTISPRTLINAARLGLLRGSWRLGLTLAFVNKMSKVDREVVSGLAQRVFG